MGCHAVNLATEKSDYKSENNDYKEDKENLGKTNSRPRNFLDLLPGTDMDLRFQGLQKSGRFTM